MTRESDEGAADAAQVSEERTVDPAQVRRELARLAAGEPVPAWSRAQVVERAEAAATDLDRAAAFVGGGGVARLERAVTAAERAGDASLARRGRRLLREYGALSSAVSSGEAEGSVDSGRPSSDSRRSAPVPPRSRNP